MVLEGGGGLGVEQDRVLDQGSGARRPSLCWTGLEGLTLWSQSQVHGQQPIGELMSGRSVVPVSLLLSRLFLQDPRGGGVWGPGQPRPTHPPTSEKFSSGKK